MEVDEAVRCNVDAVLRSSTMIELSNDKLPRSSLAVALCAAVALMSHSHSKLQSRDNKQVTTNKSQPQGNNH
jgi:hypothetical protein